MSSKNFPIIFYLHSFLPLHSTVRLRVRITCLCFFIFDKHFQIQKAACGLSALYDSRGQSPTPSQTLEKLLIENKTLTLNLPQVGSESRQVIQLLYTCPSVSGRHVLIAIFRMWHAVRLSSKVLHQLKERLSYTSTPRCPTDSNEIQAFPLQLQKNRNNWSTSNLNDQVACL